MTELGSHGNQSPPSSGTGSPVVKQLDPRDRETYGKYPTEESPDLVSCPKCKRPILRHAVKGHLESCTSGAVSVKTGANGDGKDKAVGNSNGNEMNGEASGSQSKSKKRKQKDGILSFVLNFLMQLRKWKW